VTMWKFIQVTGRLPQSDEKDSPTPFSQASINWAQEDFEPV
jgi:hypothetical protein